MNSDKNMTREIVKFSIVVVYMDSVEDGKQYFLHLDQFVNGYNFFGGSINGSESPREAACRTLREDLCSSGLRKRWACELSGELPEIEWEKISVALQPLDGTSLDKHQLPFLANQSSNNQDSLERLAEINLFQLVVSKEEFPGLFERLIALTQQNIYFRNCCETSICKIFTIDALVTQSWSNQDNPFIRFVFKKGVLKLPSEYNFSAPYLLHPPALEKYLERRLTILLKRIFDLHYPTSKINLDVTMHCPGEDEIKLRLQTNRTVNATIEIRCSESIEVLRFVFPYPAHGVFVLRSDTPKNRRASKWIWHPRLVGAPGLWWLRKHTIKRGVRETSKSLRLVLGDRKHFNLTHHSLRKSYFLSPYAYDDKLRGNLTQYTAGIRDIFPFWYFRLKEKSIDKPPGSSPINGPQKTEEPKIDLNFDPTEFHQTFDKVISILNEERNHGDTGLVADQVANERPDLDRSRHLFDPEPLDEQDISWQRLYTYSALLIDRIFSFFAKKINKKVVTSKEVSYWQALYGYGNPIRIIKTTDYIKSGWFHYFDPMNNLDSLSQLTSFQRYDRSKDMIEQLPSVFRQNHPSFKGFICPVETPESKEVGITLHLARGVRVDVLGRMFPPSDNMISDNQLGYGASVVPFYQHNDGPRSMMGAKNLKQAVPIKGRCKPCVITGHESTVKLLTDSARRIGLTPSCSAPVPGVDLLVAFMPWYGWNMEDAIVANKRLVDEGVLDWETIEKNFEYILPGYIPTIPSFEHEDILHKAIQTRSYDAAGLRRIGWINPNDPIGYFKEKKSGNIVPLLFDDDNAGELIAISYSEPASPLLGGSIQWTIRRTCPLMVGDKLMGRYGNKGVVSTILDPSKLPRLPDDKRLPLELRGRSVDLILNPHGVISRMNLGQLLETSIGLLHYLDKSVHYYPDDVGKAFQETDLTYLKEGFRKINGTTEDSLIDDYGRMILTLPDGKKTKCPVVVGYQHIVRLKHVAARKAQVRGWSNTSSNFTYSAITGQPVGGRRRSGGQRVGEMEIWALAANQAAANLQSILTAKSDPSFSGKKPIRQGQTFQAIKDHLFALGIESVESREGNTHFAWATKEKISTSCKKVTSSDIWSPHGVEGICHCSHENCEYSSKKMQITGKNQRVGVQPTIRDALRYHGYQLSKESGEGIPIGITGKKAASIIIKLEHTQGTFAKSKNVAFIYKRTVKDTKVSVKIGRQTYSAYKQINSSIWISLEMLEGYFLACPNHPSTHLICKNLSLSPFPLPEGLSDPGIFGDVSVTDWNPDSWGYLELPAPIPYPNISPLRLGKNDNPPQLEYIPILPLKYRHRGFTKIGTALFPKSDQLTDLYREMLVHKRSGTKSIEKIEILVEELFRQLHNRLFGKFGLLRRDGLGRRVDGSGRLVIVPDPTLPWDSCGVPTEILIQLLGPKIAKHPKILRGFINDKSTNNQVKAIFEEDSPDVTASKSVEDLVSSEGFWTQRNWFKKEISQNHLNLAYRVIKHYLAEFPQTTVVLNRQPSLHRYSIMSFHPIPLHPEDGLVLKINPLVCKGFGADFDGDEMAIHFPENEMAQIEAETMNPTKGWNLISCANGQPMANFDQDFVAGHFVLSQDNRAREEMKELLADSCDSQPQCEVCERFMRADTPWDKNHGTELLHHLCVNHPKKVATTIQRWMSLAFKAITEFGLSFGFLELRKLQEEYQNETDNILREMQGEVDQKALSQKTDALGKMVLEKLKLLTTKSFDEPGQGFATLAVSGARGSKQTRQLVSARGFLGPGDTGFNSEEQDFFLSNSLVAGMHPADSFMAAMNSRSSMIDKKLGTGKAGALMRSLVLASWPWTVKAGDCGLDRSTLVNVLTKCQWQNQFKICSNCYGKLNSYDTFPDGYPAGLIAAQSFGERGTQLSMQSFHTAEKQLSIDEIVSLLDGKDRQIIAGNKNMSDNPIFNYFKSKKDLTEFIKRIRTLKSYEKIEERHLELIWLIIHNSPGQTIKSAWENSRSPIAGLIGPRQWLFLLQAIRTGMEDTWSSPFARVITSQVPLNMMKEESDKQ